MDLLFSKKHILNTESARFSFQKIQEDRKEYIIKLSAAIGK